MRRFPEPAPAPSWARETMRTIRKAMTDVWPGPLRLRDYAAAELPPAPQHKQGLVYDGDAGAVRYSDGSAWAALSAAGHGHGEADLVLPASDRLVGRDAPGAGPAEALTVGGGLEFTGAGGIRRSALTGEVAAAAGSGVVTIADNAVVNARLADMAEARLKGRAAAAGTGDPADLSPAEARIVLRSGCMVKKSATETGINASAGNFILGWDGEVYDDGGWHDNLANNSRLSVPAGVSRVRVGCTLAFANVAGSSQVSVAIYRNGLSAAYDGRPVFGQTSPSATIQPTMTLASGPVPVTGGTDYFTVALFCSDASIDVTTSSFFWIEAC